MRDLSADEPPTGGGDGLEFGPRSQLWQDLPGGEPSDELLMTGVGDASEVFDQPAFEQADLLVHERLFTMMVGTLQLSRALSDRKFSDEVLERGIENGLTFMG